MSGSIDKKRLKETSDAESDALSVSWSTASSSAPRDKKHQSKSPHGELVRDPGPSKAPAPGIRGPPGPPGQSTKWFVQDNSEIETGSCPQKHDFLLNTSDYQIYQFICEEWLPTGQFISCLDCNQVLECLKKIACPPKTTDCTIYFKLLDCDPLFHSGKQFIKQLIINGKSQKIPKGTFTCPAGLGQLLASAKWHTEDKFQTNFYIKKWEKGTITKDSQIVFEEEKTGCLTIVEIISECPETHCPCPPCDLSKAKILVCCDDNLFWVDKKCLCKTLSGCTGAVVDCQVVEDCLCQIPEFDQNCQYIGIFDPLCTDYLEDICQANNLNIYRILTALGNSSNVVSGPVEFADQASYITALNALNIIAPSLNCNDPINQPHGIITVTSSPSKIDRVYVLNSSGGVVANFALTETVCCPDDDCYVLTMKPPAPIPCGQTGPTGTCEFFWTKKECFNDINKERFLSMLNCIPPCFPYQCVLTIKVVDVFQSSNPEIANPFPWIFTQFVINGNEFVHTGYAVPFSSITGLENILLDNGWREIVPNSGCFTMAFPLESLDDKENSFYRIQDAGQTPFICQSIPCDCQPSCQPGATDVIYHNRNTGEFCLGSAEKICDLFPSCNEFESGKLIGEVLFHESGSTGCCWKLVDIDVEKIICEDIVVCSGPTGTTLEGQVLFRGSEGETCCWKPIEIDVERIICEDITVCPGSTETTLEGHVLFRGSEDETCCWKPIEIDVERIICEDIAVCPGPTGTTLEGQVLFRGFEDETCCWRSIEIDVERIICEDIAVCHGSTGTTLEGQVLFRSSEGETCCWQPVNINPNLKKVKLSFTTPGVTQILSSDESGTIFLVTNGGGFSMNPVVFEIPHINGYWVKFVLLNSPPQGIIFHTVEPRLLMVGHIAGVSTSSPSGTDNSLLLNASAARNDFVKFIVLDNVLFVEGFVLTNGAVIFSQMA